MSYASDNNEVAFFDLSQSNPLCNIYMVSTAKAEETYIFPQLKQSNNEISAFSGGS